MHDVQTVHVIQKSITDTHRLGWLGFSAMV